MKSTFFVDAFWRKQSPVHRCFFPPVRLKLCWFKAGLANTADSTIMYVRATQTFAFGVLACTARQFNYTQKIFCGSISVQWELIISHTRKIPVSKPFFSI